MEREGSFTIKDIDPAFLRRLIDGAAESLEVHQSRTSHHVYVVMIDRQLFTGRRVLWGARRWNDVQVGSRQDSARVKYRIPRVAILDDLTRDLDDLTRDLDDLTRDDGRREYPDDRRTRTR